MNSLTVILRAILRLTQIIFAGTRFVLLPYFYRDRPPLPIRLRQAVEYLGGAWVKIGQGLATRFDLLPYEYCAEFLKLLNETNNFPYAVVRDIVKEEFGRFPEELFAAFDPQPLAAASIAQVHKAVSLDGTLLAVKVQRPSVRAQFASDFLLMYWLSYCLGFIDKHAGRSARAFVNESRRWTYEELDFRNEARNGHRMGLFSEGVPIHVDAKIQFNYSTSQILTTEYLSGVPLLEIIRAIQRDDRLYLWKLKESGIDLQAVARNISWNFLNQTLRDGFFHADLHPANLVVLPGNAIGYFDYGIVGRLSDTARESLQAFMRYMIHGDLEKAVSEVLTWAEPDPTTNVELARQDLRLFYENFHYGSITENRRPLQITSRLITEMMSVTRRHRLTISPDLLLYFKAALTSDAVVYQIAPNYDLFSEGERFIVRSFELDIKEFLKRNGVKRVILSLTHRATLLRDDLETIQGMGQTTQEWLDTLQTRIMLYGFWASALGIGAYVIYQSTADRYFSGFDAVQPWLVGGMTVGAIAFLVLIWRQGRRSTAIKLDRPAARIKK